jgi:hypothetical protein
MQRGAEQRRGQKAVLPVADIDEGRWEGGRDQQGFASRQNRAQHGEIRSKSRNQPHRDSPTIGNCGDEERDCKEERWIVPAVEWHLAPAEDRLLGGVLKRGLVGLGGAALPGQRTRRIDVGEIGAERLAIAVDQPVGDGDPAGEGEGADNKQDQAVAACARAASQSRVRRALQKVPCQK